MKVPFVATHATNYTDGRTVDIDRIVIHYTAGDGDTAENNGKYFSGANRQASAHYFVDADSIVQTVKEGDTAWHAGNWAMNCRSIGIEMCSKKDSNGKYYIPEATVANTVALVKELMKKYDIPAAGVIRHYDVNGKKCPEPFVRTPALWDDFRKRLTATTATTTKAALYRVQVGAFSQKANADRLKKELESKGYPAIVVQVKV